MSIRSSMKKFLVLVFGLLLMSRCSAFVPATSRTRQTYVIPIANYCKTCLISNECKMQPIYDSQSFQLIVGRSSSSRLFMSDSDNQGQGLLATIGVGLIIVIFVASGLLPSLLEGGGDRDLSIADSVVTRQDMPGKLANFESAQDRLSRSEIQDKLSAIPVFFLATPDGSMKTDIFLSYADAKEASAETDSTAVKVTTLDQVM